MEEKVIIKSEISKVVKGICILFLILGVILFVVFAQMNCVWTDWETGTTHFSSDMIPFDLAISVLPCAIISFIIWYIYGHSELTVTDKRVYGKAIGGKRVDIPLDSISAVGTSSFLKGVSVASSSGRLVFTAIANNNEIHKVISDLLLARQSKNRENHPTIVKQEVSQSNADELKKYKNLLDSGIISQEEFEAKKKQLLGL